MGHKKVCLNCNISFNLQSHEETLQEHVCPECGMQMKILPHRFRPPKKNETKKWEVVKFLVNNGFGYQHIYETVEIRKGKIISLMGYVDYPENMIDAKEFIEKFKNQSLK